MLVNTAAARVTVVSHVRSRSIRQGVARSVGDGAPAPATEEDSLRGRPPLDATGLLTMTTGLTIDVDDPIDTSLRHGQQHGRQ